jgi:hypothetical protein
LNDKFISEFPLTNPRRSMYATPFEYRMTRFIGSIADESRTAVTGTAAARLLPTFCPPAENAHTDIARSTKIFLICSFYPLLRIVFRGRCKG